MVYRKKSDHLIDWHIHNHPNKELVEQSKIRDCEKTNIWEISPKVNKFHPAVFPIELSNKIIQYYSFIDDFVLDPFAGSGTVGISAIKNKRQFILMEKEQQYFNLIKNNILPYIEHDKIEIIEE
jgi:DNA modification methylase